MSDLIEREWQFEASDLEAVERWLAAPPDHAPFDFAVGEAKLQQDTYLDTPGWRIHRAGFTLRRRARGDAFEATLKALARGTADLATRREVTERLDGPEVLGGDGEVATRVRLVAARESLRPVVEVHTRRWPVDVLRHGEVVASVALDDTTLLRDGTVTGTLCRVEVEVVDQSVQRDLDALVRVMARDCGLAPALTSKFQAALDAAGLDASAEALDFGPTGLDPAAGATAYGYGWLRRHWAAFLQHEPGTRLGEDVEALHQMRVATRRLRATIALFREVLPERFGVLRDELQWVGHELGAVRDLDVQIDGLRAQQDVHPAESAAIQPLIAVLEAQRVAERDRLITLLDSDRFVALEREMGEMLRSGARSDAPVVAVHQFAAPVLHRRLRSVHRAGVLLAADSHPAEYHALRIRGKRLRYSLELFGDLYGRPARDLTDAVKQVQDLLGEHQDADVMNDWLRATVRECADRLPVDTLVALGGLIERNRQVMAERRAAYPTLFARLDGPRRTRFRRTLAARRGEGRRRR
jgi:triphosphatase